MSVRMLMLTAQVLSCIVVQAQVTYKPRISTMMLKVDPIMNNNDPVFHISGITVDVPGLKRQDEDQVCEVLAVIKWSTVRDLKTNETYRVTASVVDLAFAVTDELQSDSSGHVELAPYRKTCRVRLELTGGPIPLRRGMVKGNISVLLIAVYTDRAGIVYESEKMIPILASN
ncbi:MAG: hypothetical protein JSS89_05400 [Bacteroidetes bacterium]|nr:hypothetical protein [Bacteroidota bacterium]